MERNEPSAKRVHPDVQYQEYTTQIRTEHPECSHKKAKLTREVLEEHDTSYFPTTSVPMNGWFQPCRYCFSWTASTIEAADGAQVPICKRCKVRLMDWMQSQMLLAQQSSQLHLSALPRLRIESVTGSLGTSSEGPSSPLGMSAFSETSVSFEAPVDSPRLSPAPKVLGWRQNQTSQRHNLSNLQTRFETTGFQM